MSAPQWFKDGWRPAGPGACRCPRCGGVCSTNALARARHACRPTVRKIRPDTYRITGAVEAAEWTPRPGREAWCEVTVRDRAVVAYGGEVWPGAWPSLFSIGQRTTQGQAVTLTKRGADLLAAAR